MRRTLATLLLLLALPAAASGQQADAGAPDDEEAVVPGVDETPPGPDDDDEEEPPELPADLGARRAIRGEPLDDGASEDANRKALREFEEEAFGAERGRLDPSAGDAVRGAAPAPPTAGTNKDALPAALRSADHALAARAVSRGPGDLRPDLPWLKGLATGDLPVRWDERVIRYLEFYKEDPRGRALMTGWLKGMQRFRPLIEEAIERHGLPKDLIYVCMIESSFSPLSTSWASAVGLWQFIPAAARVYGLRMDYWVDERRDPVKQTEAALTFLADLHARFGTWELALAAYNAGHGTVLSSIAKFNTNDFWALLDLENGLPWASSIYVPKAMAAAVVGHNLEVFGFADVAGDPPFEYERVSVPPGVALAVVARAAGVDAEVVRALNPELRRGRTPPGTEYTIRIPVGRKEQFARTFPQLRGDWDGVDAYVLRYGERFEDVARTFGVSVSKLRELNGVDDLAELHGGTVIVVPRIEEDARRRNQAAADADLYRSDSAPGDPGDPMLVAVPDKDFHVPGRKRVFYRVVAGDSLATVAAVFGVRPGDLASWNGLDLDAHIQARMVLSVWVEPSFDADRALVKLLDESRLQVVTAGSAEHMKLVELRKGRRRIIVKARRGDTLDSIARRHGLKGSDLARINHRNAHRALDEGDEIVVYTVVDRVKARQAGVLDKSHGRHSKSTKAKVRRGKTSKSKPSRGKAVTGKATRGKAPRRRVDKGSRGKRRSPARSRRRR